MLLDHDNLPSSAGRGAAAPIVLAAAPQSPWLSDEPDRSAWHAGRVPDGAAGLLEEAVIWGDASSPVPEGAWAISKGKSLRSARLNTLAAQPLDKALRWFSRTTERSEKDGSWFAPGVFSGKHRGDRDVAALHWVTLDIDNGTAIATALDALRQRGWFAIAYSSFSHGKAETIIADAAVKRALPFERRAVLGGAINAERGDVLDYLQREKGFSPAALKGAVVEDARAGMGINLKWRIAHQPIDRFRIVLPLSAPFVVAEQGGVKEATARWGAYGRAVAAELGLHADESGFQLSHAFLLPAHPPGAEYQTHVVIGKLLDLAMLVPIGKPRPIAGGSTDGKRRLVTPNIKRFWDTFGGRFDVSSFFEAHGEPTTRGDGRHFMCPNRDAHSTEDAPDSTAFKTWGWLEAEEELGLPVAHAKCMHASCEAAGLNSGLRWVDFVCERAGITDPTELLDFVEELEGEEEPTEVWANFSSRRAPARSAAAAPTSEEEAELEELNRRHAVVLIGKNAAILRKPEFLGEEPRFLNESAFNTLYANKRVLVGEAEKAKLMPTAKLWREWPDRNTYGEGCIFAPPPRQDRDGFYNLWQGFAVPGAAGDWSLLRDHIQDNLCHGNTAYFEWLMTWMAHLFQRPGEKPGSAVVIRGNRGTGKSKLFDHLAKAIGGAHSITVNRGELLTGKFNAHQHSRILMVAEEAFFAGDRGAGSVLKDLITNERQTIEQKGVDAFSVDSFLRVAITSNEDWVVPAAMAGEERRFFVLQSTDDRKGDTDFFAAIDRQMAAGGLAAMVCELQHWVPPQANGWDCLRKPPVTPWLKDQAREGLNILEEWVMHIVEEGGLYGDSTSLLDERAFDEGSETIVRGKLVYEHARAYAKGRRGAQDVSDRKTLDVLRKTLELKAPRAEHGYPGRCLKFPPLPEMRARLQGKGLIAEEGDDSAS